MTVHGATVSWDRGGAAFLDRRYSRSHLWSFDGSASVRASASPHIVPEPFCDPKAIDPEEAFVASIASCHMLWFLDIAARGGFIVNSYRDEARGFLGPRADGREAILRVELNPQVGFGEGKGPDAARHIALHELAHQSCFIANSVTCEIICEPAQA